MNDMSCDGRRSLSTAKKERLFASSRKSIEWRGCKWNCQKGCCVEDDVFLSTRLLYTDGAKRVGDV